MTSELTERKTVEKVRVRAVTSPSSEVTVGGGLPRSCDVCVCVCVPGGGDGGEGLSEDSRLRGSEPHGCRHHPAGDLGETSQDRQSGVCSVTRWSR